jgi:hypothetical protein
MIGADDRRLPSVIVTLPVANIVPNVVLAATLPGGGTLEAPTAETTSTGTVATAGRATGVDEPGGVNVESTNVTRCVDHVPK